jgi:iron complex outermembrane receptor protein
VTGQGVAPPAAASNKPAASTAAAPAGKLEEIIVTARQRPETQVSVPISMQVFSAAKIQAAGIFDLNTLQYQAGFTFQQAASTAAGGREFPALIFRGLQSTYGGGQDNSGSLFVDGIYISGGQASIDTIDVSRIEVLKGPQNVYFGKNTFGGAINFITSNPSNEYKGEIDASGSARGSYNINATAEGPLIPGLLTGRITVLDYEKAAQYQSGDSGALGEERTLGVTGTLYATPADGLWFRARGHYQQDNDSAADVGFLPGTVYGSNCNGGRGTNAAGDPEPITLTSPYFCGNIPSLGRTGNSVLNQNTQVPQPFLNSLATNTFTDGQHDPLLPKVPSLDHSGLRRDLEQYSGQMGYELPYGLNFAANVGYNGMQSLDIWDLDRSPAGAFINAQPEVTHDLTADARITTDQSARLRGLVGVSFYHSSYEVLQDDDNFYGFDNKSSPFGFPLYGGTSVQDANYANETDKTASVYASLDLDILKWLTATAEARYQDDTIRDLPLTGSPYHKTYNNYLPRFILKVHPSDDWDIYASYSEGIQPPQLQTSYIDADPAARAYLDKVDPGANEYTQLPKLKSYEIGAKQVLFDGRVGYGIALYDEKWDNQLTSAAVFNPVGCGQTTGTAGCPLPTSGSFLYLANNADIKGVEFNGAVQITRQWSADLEVDYKRAKWVDYYNSTLSTFTGGVDHFNHNTLSRVPDWQGVFSTSYHDKLTEEWNWFARVQVSFQGSMYESDVDIGKTNPWARVNASIGVTRGPLSIELYGINIFNDKNWDWASRVPILNTNQALETNYGQYMGVLVQAPDVPDVGLKLRYKFGLPPAASPPPPAEAAAPVPAPDVVPARTYLVFFDWDRADLTDRARQIVASAASASTHVQTTRLEVNGYTDLSGTAAYNQKLSVRRAQSVETELVRDGVPTAEISIHGFGESNPLVPTAKGVREPQNRRVEIILK